MSDPRTSDQVRTILTADDRLDDITRARMWSKIEDRLVEPAPQRESTGRKRAGGVVLAAFAAAAMVIFVVRTVLVRNDEHVVTVAADAMLTSRLGPHTHAALVGPARLERVGPAGDVTAARLYEGTLLAEFEGGPARSLRIEAGDLTVDIVGTLFAIEVQNHDACVSVAHGTVRVTGRGAVWLVTDRQQLCSGDLVPHVIPEAVSDQLVRHERSMAIAMAPLAPSPVPDPVAVAPAERAPSRLPSAAPVTGVPARASSPTANASPAERTARADSAPTPRRVSATSPTASAPPTSAAPPIDASDLTRTPPPVPTAAVGSASAVARTAADVVQVPATTAVAEGAPEAPPRPALPPSAEALYHAAEVALAAGDRTAADRALARIPATPGSALADQALYERARIAYQAGSWAAARGYLATLATFPTSALAEPGRYLDCRIAVKARDRDAEGCFAAYRLAYPRSPHDLDVLAVLVQLAHARASCDGARVLRDELIARYPRTDHAAAWRSRCVEAP